jgi:hypothetical protein
VRKVLADGRLVPGCQKGFSFPERKEERKNEREKTFLLILGVYMFICLPTLRMSIYLEGNIFRTPRKKVPV